jgi:hypothetical protein
LNFQNIKRKAIISNTNTTNKNDHKYSNENRSLKFIPFYYETRVVNQENSNRENIKISELIMTRTSSSTNNNNNDNNINNHHNQLQHQQQSKQQAYSSSASTTTTTSSLTTGVTSSLTSTSSGVSSTSVPQKQPTITKRTISFNFKKLFSRIKKTEPIITTTTKIVPCSVLKEIQATTTTAAKKSAKLCLQRNQEQNNYYEEDNQYYQPSNRLPINTSKTDKIYRKKNSNKKFICVKVI